MIVSYVIFPAIQYFFSLWPSGSTIPWCSLISVYTHSDGMKHHSESDMSLSASDDNKISADVEIRQFALDEMNVAPNGSDHHHAGSDENIPASQSEMAPTVHDCYICKRSLASRSQLKHHLWIVHQVAINLWKCSEPKCVHSYKTREQLNKHIWIVHGSSEKLDANFKAAIDSATKCPHCRYYSCNKSHMQRHISNRHNGKNKKIRKVGLSSSLLKSVKTKINRCSAKSNNVRMKVLTQIYHCPQPGCNLRTRLKGSLSRHLMEIHCGVTRKRNKQVCSVKKNTATAAIDAHEAASDSCSDLPVGNCNVADLSMDIKTTDGVEHGEILPPDSKPRCDRYICSYCSKELRQKMALHNHIATHNLRPYQCPHCELRYNYRGNAVKHMRNAHGEKDVLTVIELSLADAAKLSTVNSQIVTTEQKDGPASTRKMKARKSRSLNTAVTLQTVGNVAEYASNVFKETVMKQEKSDDFSVKAEMVAHEEGVNHGSDSVVNKIMPYGCSSCDCRFMYRGSFYRHRTKVHPEAHLVRLNIDHAKFSNKGGQGRHKPVVSKKGGIRLYTRSKTKANGQRQSMRNRINRLHSRLIQAGDKHMDKTVPHESEAAVTNDKRLSPHGKLPSGSGQQHSNRLSPLNGQPSCSRVRRCPQCTFTCLNSKSMRKHMSSVHSDSITDRLHRKLNQRSQHSSSNFKGYKRFKCSECLFRCNYRKSVQQHIKLRHLSTKAYVVILSEELARKTVAEYDRLYKGRTNSQLSCLENTSEGEIGSIAGSATGSTAAINERPAVDGSSLGESKVACDVLDFATKTYPDSVTDEKFRFDDSTRIYYCNICPYVSYKVHHVWSHVRMHTQRPGSVKCAYCPYFASKAGFIKQHEFLHENPGAAMKKLIGKSPGNTPVKSAVNNPVKSQIQGHDGNDREPKVKGCSKVVFCDICPFMVQGSLSVCNHRMVAHRQLHRPRACATFKCTLCNYWARERCGLAAHMRVHDPDYVVKRLYGSKSRAISSTPAQPSIKTELPDDVEMEKDTLETAAFKQKLIATRYSLSRSPRRLGSMAVKSPTYSDTSSPAHGKCVNGSPSQNNISSTNAHAAFADDDNKCLQLWRCEKCPYSSENLTHFKRHVYLHGRRLGFECAFCDYSVPAYWQLSAHRQLHLVQNQNLLLTQSVTNLLFLPSRTVEANTVTATNATCKQLKLFEDSKEFSACDVPPFRCSHCPFVTDRRTDFHPHLRCHFAQSLFSCPLCNFGAPTKYLLMSHVTVHFTLPGCDSSSLPPNAQVYPLWQSVSKCIETFSLKAAENIIENAKTNVEVVTRHSFQSGLSECLKEEHIKRSSIPCSADVSDYDIVHLPPRKFEVADNGSEDRPDNVCRYCDRPFSNSELRAKHEAGHLVGSF